MALIVKDRIKETTTTTGTGTVTLAGASDGFQAFSVVGNANTTYYAIVSGDNWEVGLGTYTLSGTTLSRDTILESNNSGAAITLAGTSDVFCTYPAEKAVTLNGTVINDADVVATANIVDNAVTLAKMAGGTDGNLITYDTSGDPAYVPTGTTGQILTSAGADAVPTFQTAAGGGGLTLLSTVATTSGTEIVASGLDLSTYKFLVVSAFSVGASSDGGIFEWKETGGTYTLISYRTVTSTVPFYGIMHHDLANGVTGIMASSYTATNSAANTPMTAGSAGCATNTGIDTATTSIIFDWAGGHTFNLGSISIYGVK